MLDPNEELKGICLSLDFTEYMSFITKYMGIVYGIDPYSIELYAFVDQFEAIRMEEYKYASQDHIDDVKALCPNMCDCFEAEEHLHDKVNDWTFYFTDVELSFWVDSDDNIPTFESLAADAPEDSNDCYLLYLGEINDWKLKGPELISKVKGILGKYLPDEFDYENHIGYFDGKRNEDCYMYA